MSEIETNINIPKPKIQARTYDAAQLEKSLEDGLHPVLARILAARPLPIGFLLSDVLSPRLSHLSSPFTMAEMQKASQRLAEAIIDGECIGIETDHDCDGQTSHAVMYDVLTRHFRHPAEKLRSYIGHRLQEGYGLSDKLANRILEDDPRPTLVLTADNGSSDEPRIKRLKAAGIDVIVTDHHEIPQEGCPKSAYACLNPTRKDCEYNDPYIAGCMVAWLLMAATRSILMEKGYLDQNALHLADTLDFVAVGTIADCVSIARSMNNRAVVTYGMKLIEAGRRPCWRALRSVLSFPLRSDALGFRIGPLLNSDGRLSSAFGSVTFLLAKGDREAQEWVDVLSAQNENRKTIQRDIMRQAIRLAKQQVGMGRKSLCIYLENGHAGVQGIAASRIAEMFGRPTAIFAPKMGGEDLLTGSVRSIKDFHVRNALQFIADLQPNLLIAFGGHEGAGGLTLRLADFKSLSQAFEKAACQQLADRALYPVVWTDGSLEAEHLNLDLVDALSVLEPFGREFEQPLFEIDGELTDLRPVGDGTHIRVSLKKEGKIFAGIWFGAKQAATDILPFRIGAEVKVACSVKDNQFRGKRAFDMHIVHMDCI